MQPLEAACKQRIAHQSLLMFHHGNKSAIKISPGMSVLPNNEWNLLKEEFGALVHKEGAHEGNLQQFFDDGIRRRFGELIAWAAWHKAKGHHGPWPPGPYRGNR